MAVLKTFELHGNKKSFANWISNLSPTSTPFTSMIGKEEIDQTQYSWQTDSLAPASAETFEEGSQATLQPRAATKIFTNFTSLVRRAVRVSDTNEATAAYGRRDELAYQMGKAGQAVLRDVEYMNLSTRSGTPGSATQASAHAGFKDLCAPLFMPDTDTFALTHQGIAVVDKEKPWFALKDIFKVTSELFLSGSRADKIMFHPKHINIFSDHIGYNEEEPQIFRMFDGLDTKYNALVSKIKDPVGRVYTLIPNRWMPEGQIYIFSEDDWTQMVLQQPVRKKLAKSGSSTATYVETEVGLRHKHPHASGVLDLVVVTYKAHLTPERTKLTAFIDDQVRIHLSVTDLDDKGIPNVVVKLKTNPSGVVDLRTDEITTGVDGTDVIFCDAKQPGKAVAYGYNFEEGKTLLTNPVSLEVVPPTVEISLAADKAEVWKRQTLNFTVTDVTGKPVPAGTTLYVDVDEGLEIAGVDTDHAIVDANGNAVFNFYPKYIGKLHFRVGFEAGVGKWRTFPYEVDVVDNQYKLVFSEDTKHVLTHKIDGTQFVGVTLFEGINTVAGEKVSFESTNTLVVNFLSEEYETNASGLATAQMSIVGIGEARINATYKNKTTSFYVRVGDGFVKLTIDRPVIEVDDQTGATISGQLLGADGEPLLVANQTINWGSIPDNVLQFSGNTSTTNSEGKFSVGVKDSFQSGKFKIGANWTLNGIIEYIDFEVIPTQFQIAFNNSELHVVGGVGETYDVSVKVEHPWADLGDHELEFYSSDNRIAAWKNPEGKTDDSGFVTPVNSITAVGYGNVTLTVDSHETESEFYKAGYLDVISHKPEVSMTATYTELLEGDSGEITLTLEKPNGLGSGIIPHTGPIKVIVNRYGIETADTVQMTGGKANISYKGLRLGRYPISIALADGVELPNKTPMVLSVVHPNIRLTATPEEYEFGKTIKLEAFLTRPTSGSKASLAGREITFRVEPNVLEGVPTGTKATTNDVGYASVTSGNIQSNADFEILAYFNGVSASYTLMRDYS